MRTFEGSIASTIGFVNSWWLNCLGLSARIHLARATGGSVDFASCTLQFKDKIKTVGVARQQLHFLCSDKENEANESFAVRFIYIVNYVLDLYIALRWACLVRQGGNINSGCSNRSKIQISPVGDEALESLSLLWRVVTIVIIFRLFPCKSHCKEKALLHTFVAGQKYGVGRDATRRFCSFKKAQGQLVVQMLP